MGERREEEREDSEMNLSHIGQRESNGGREGGRGRAIEERREGVKEGQTDRDRETAVKCV